MAYTKTTWATDDIITASGLNNMENGIDSVANVVTDTGASAKTTYFNSADFHVRKQGNIVTVQFVANPKADIGAWYTMATISDGFRPQEATYFVGFYGTAVMPFTITTSGNIQPLAAVSGTSRLAFIVTYVVA